MKVIYFSVKQVPKRTLLPRSSIVWEIWDCAIGGCRVLGELIGGILKIGFTVGFLAVVAAVILRLLAIVWL